MGQKKQMKKNILLITFLAVGFLAYTIGKKIYLSSGLTNGVPAPAFNGVNLEGARIDNSTFLGDYLLIDFWGSWCGPCRKENPILRDLVMKYSDRDFSDAEGFSIVSVGIETKEDKWKAAIKKDRLEWPHHISALSRFEDPIAEAFDIRSIPQQVLIGPKGNILMVNVGLPDIDAFLSKKVK